MNSSMLVDNIKCGGCANRIIKRLSNIVTDVKVDEIHGKVDFSYDKDIQVEQVIAALKSMGYTQLGESKFSDKAVSYVSCMIGRLSK